uniref:Immunoglobulin V-set domain-containing protein n=1 Tax=Esox lucius TaxID=8010 RepID=A0AAY5KS38_ESOLU
TWLPTSPSSSSSSSSPDPQRGWFKFTLNVMCSITIPCHYDQKYIHYVKYWCKGFWDFCKYAARTDKTMGTKTSISDDLIRRVFTVTMTDLTPADSDYYWCAVEINKGPDIRIQRFYLSITVKPHSVTTLSTTTNHSEYASIHCLFVCNLFL